MYTKFCVSPDTAANFMRLFVNRRAYCIQVPKLSDPGSFEYKKRSTPMDTGVVRMHLNGDITINLYAINPKTQRSKWVAIDADYTDALRDLGQLKVKLKADGVEAALEQSRRGGHLWIFAAAPLLASDCRIYIYNLALTLGIPVMGGGLKEGIEVFPKQDDVKDGKYGNAIRAPLGVHRKTNQRYWFYDADLNPEAQLSYLNQVKKLTEADLKTRIQGMSLPAAYKPPTATPFIPRPATQGREEFHILRYVQVNERIRDPRNWVAQCPSCAQAGHDRGRDNLKIKKSEPQKYRCWRGCTKEDIRAALGQPIRRKQFA
jgi:hypothetical protein